jgi:ADP-ribose pyrophosphatase YjhB (NUDIX family)
MQKYKTACAVIINHKDEILLIKRGRSPFKDCWALISGIGESMKGILPEVGIYQEVKWDLGTDLLNKKYLFSWPIENDEYSDEIVVFTGKIDEENIKLRAGYSEDWKWVPKNNIQELENLAFEHSVIIKKFLQEYS